LALGDELDGDLVTVPLVFSTREGPLVRGHYNLNVWKPALTAAGVEPTRANGMHALRHYYASVLLDDGVSIRALADIWVTRTRGSPFGPTRT